MKKAARQILSPRNKKLDKFFFVGGSGGEACEASMKIAYLYNKSIGYKKKNGSYQEKNLITGQVRMLYQLEIEKSLYL